MASFAVYRAYVDWDGDGDFSEPIEEITNYVKAWNWTTGKPSSSRMGRGAAGSCSLELDNSTSRFSKNNSGSPLYGLIAPGLTVRITMTIGGGSEVTQWQGDLDAILTKPGPQLSGASATLVGRGILTRFTESKKAAITMQTDVASGTAIGEILDAVGFPAGLRQLDAGQSTLGRFWTDGKSAAINAIRSVSDTEGGDILETKDGKLAFEARNHRLLAPHNSPQATYTNDPSGTIRYSSIEPEGDERRDICNVVEVEVRTFDLSEDVVLWEFSGDPPAVGAGQTVVIEAPFPNPRSSQGYLAVSDWTMTDYEANTASDGSGTDVTSDVSVVETDYASKKVLEITNNGGSTAYLITLRCHGIAVVESDPILISATDQPSIDAFEERGFPWSPRFLTDRTEAQNYADHYLALLKDPTQGIVVGLEANANSDHLLEAQTRAVSDRIHVDADYRTGLYLNEDYFVEKLVHSITENLHRVQIYASPANTHSWGTSGTSRTPKTIPSPGNKVPDDLEVVGWPTGMNINVGCRAWKYNADIDLAEFRAKRYAPGTELDYADLRTPAEGGTLVHDGVDSLIITDMFANYNGANYGFVSANEGSWYIAFRFHNGSGRSVWSDGNTVPEKVKDHFATNDDYDTGPPDDWNAWIEAGPSGTAVIKASRPETNGWRILFAGWQLRNVNDGAAEATFQDLDDDSDPSDTKYDGSAIDHTLNASRDRLTRNSGSGMGTAAAGDLLMVDVRGGAFSQEHTVFMQIAGVGADYIQLGGPTWLPNGILTTYRIRVVACPWGWSTKGYLGATPSMGWVQTEYWNLHNADGTTGDTQTLIFSSPPIQIPTGLAIEDLVARVYYQNAYSRSWAGIESAPATAILAGYEVILADAATILTDARLSDTTPRKVYFCLLTAAVGATRVLGNPTDAKHRQPMAHILRQSASGNNGYTLGNKFRTIARIPVEPSNEPGKQDYIGTIYDAYDDAFDVVSFIPGYGD